MFARGQGFIATVKCESAFRFGVAFDFIGIFAIAEYYLGPEICIFSCFLAAICYKVGVIK